MKIFKNILEYIIAFILAILILALILINVISSTIMQKEYVLSKLQETDYYSKMHEYIKSNFEKYIGQSGLEEEILNDTITEIEIKNDTKQIIANIYDGDEQEINTEKIKTKLEQNISKSLAGRVLTTTQKQAIDEFVTNLCDEYTASILHTDFENQINDVYETTTKYKEITFKIIAIVTVILVIILILLNFKNPYNIMIKLGVSGLVASISLMIVNIIVNTSINIRHITIFNEAFENVVKAILSDILENLTVYGIVLLVSSLLSIIIFNLLKNKKKYKKHIAKKQS